MHRRRVFSESVSSPMPSAANSGSAACIATLRRMIESAEVNLRPGRCPSEHHLYMQQIVNGLVTGRCVGWTRDQLR